MLILIYTVYTIINKYTLIFNTKYTIEVITQD